MNGVCRYAPRLLLLLGGLLCWSGQSDAQSADAPVTDGGSEGEVAGADSEGVDAEGAGSEDAGSEDALAGDSASEVPSDAAASPEEDSQGDAGTVPGSAEEPVQSAAPSGVEGAGDEAGGSDMAPEAGGDDAGASETQPDPGAPAEGDPALAHAVPVEQRPRLIVIDAGAQGVAPVVAQHVSFQLRRTADAMGYGVLSPEGSVSTARRLGMQYPPTPAELWRVTYAATARQGVFARVWAAEGRYVIEVMVASLDGTGPHFARGTSGAEDLHGVVDGLLRHCLPAPGQWDEQAHAQVTEERMVVPPELPPRVAPRRPYVPPRIDRSPGRRWDLAIQTDGAIGTSHGGFYNHLFGLRLGYRITRSLMLGIWAGYANLSGRNGRVSNLLYYAQLENRIRLGSRTDVTLPLRFAVGHVPFNGPFVRLSAGVNIPVSPRVELAVDLLSPTVWVLPERNAISLNIGAEVIFRL